MGHRCCSKQKVKRGLWSPEEDEKLIRHITTHGHASWSSVPKHAGLQRCGKSCRLRWINYLRPDLKRGTFTADEEQIIIDVHRILGNRWAQIAKHLPGRTDNEVKNFWNSCIKKKLISQGLDPTTHNLMSSHKRVSSSVSNNILSKPNHLHEQQKESPPTAFSIINVNPHSNRDSSLKINPPVAPPPDNHPHQSIVTCHQNPPLLQCPNDQINNGQTYPHDQNIFSHVPVNDQTMSIIPSSVNTSVLGLSEIDGGHYGNIWGLNEFPNEPFEALTVLQTQYQHGKEQEKEMEINRNYKADDKSSDHHRMDVSFDSSGVDLDFTTLLSSALSCDFSCMDDFAWNF